MITSATDLVTLAEAKAYLGITGSSQDTEIGNRIKSASLSIAQFIGYDAPTSARTETRDGLGTDMMPTLARPVTAVSSVTVDGVALPVSTGFNVAGYTFDDTSIILISYRFTRGRRNVSLAYTAGFATVPENIKQACYYTMKSMFDAPGVDMNVVAEAVPGAYSASYAQGGVGVIPDSAKVLLQPFKRLAMRV